VSRAGLAAMRDGKRLDAFREPEARAHREKGRREWLSPLRCGIFCRACEQGSAWEALCTAGVAVCCAPFPGDRGRNRVSVQHAIGRNRPKRVSGCGRLKSTRRLHA